MMMDLHAQGGGGEADPNGVACVVTVTVPPGCGGRPPVSATECTAECAGLAFVADANICTGCKLDGTTVIDDSNVGSLVPAAAMCAAAGDLTCTSEDFPIYVSSPSLP